jgi:hypothetical protein
MYHPPHSSGCRDLRAEDRSGHICGEEYGNEYDLPGIHQAADGVPGRRFGSEILMLRCFR